MAIIYKITNQINKKYYVGKTTRTFEERWHEHLQESKNPNPKSHFHNALNYWGIENFTHEILWEGSEEELDNQEKYFISQLNARDPATGYNIAEGGTGGVCWREGEHPSLGKDRSGMNNPFYGKHHSAETVEFIRTTNTGRIGIRKNDVYTLVRPEDLQMYLDDGWKTTVQLHQEEKHYRELEKQKRKELGIKREVPPEIRAKYALNNKGKVAINNGEVQKYVYPEDLDVYFECGWVLGGVPHGEMSETHRQHLSESLTGRTCWSKGLTKETDERVANLAMSLKGRKGAFTGKHHSDETKQLLSDIGKQRVFTEDHSDAVKAGIASMTEEAKTERKKKLSAALTGRKQSEETKQKRRETMQRTLAAKRARAELNQD